MYFVRYSFVLLCILAFTHSADYEQKIVELEKYILKKQIEIDQRYRPLFHVAPPVGWMNDPNGFVYHNGLYHLFYQYYPYDSVWDSIHWGHVSSTDLVHWRQLPTALLPEKEMCFSGSAISQGDTLTLMYTAHIVKEGSNDYNQSQYLAFSEDGLNFIKFKGNPVIESPPSGSPDFRDPKVWKHGDDYYVVIGSKNDKGNGTVLLYKSKDMISWEYLSVIGEPNEEMGYMWECPDLFELGGKYVLLMSPQGMEPDGDRYKNVYQTGYIIGTFDYNTNQFKQEVPFQELDFGHDFYAATTTAAKGERYLIAWFSMWDVPHPEDEDGWIGTMTLVRELSLKGKRIIMKPVAEVVDLRESIALDGSFSHNQIHEFGKAVELLIESNLNQTISLLLTGRDGGGKVTLKWDPQVRKVALDREGDVRQVEWLPISSHTLRIFLDTSSIELFCGEGEVVLSSRVYPLGGWRLKNQSPQTLHVKAFNLRSSVPDTSSSVQRKTLSGIIISCIMLLYLMLVF